jgi:predicted  nucleic acid-binding Zn-ribbon protein
MSDTLTIRRAEYEYQREKLDKALADLADARDEVEKWRTAAHASQRETQRLGAEVETLRAQLAEAEKSITALRKGEAHWHALATKKEAA